MKKLILIILFMALSVSSASCSAGNNRQSGRRDILSNETVHVFYPMHSSSVPGNGFVSEWEDYIYDKYGLDIDLEYVKDKGAYSSETISADSTGIRL